MLGYAATPGGPELKKFPPKWHQLEKYGGTNMFFETFQAKLAICAKYNN
jgi:hypothetical protein